MPLAAVTSSSHLKGSWIYSFCVLALRVVGLYVCLNTCTLSTCLYDEYCWTSFAWSQLRAYWFPETQKTVQRAYPSRLAQTKLVASSVEDDDTGRWSNLSSSEMGDDLESRENAPEGYVSGWSRTLIEPGSGHTSTTKLPVNNIFAMSPCDGPCQKEPGHCLRHEQLFRPASSPTNSTPRSDIGTWPTVMLDAKVGVVDISNARCCAINAYYVTWPRGSKRGLDGGKGTVGE
ncbi:hypothetical protein F5877DRAFT_73269 [Lentinula edodes]|nr:hypothetical protein F5877DRAFT_73269 [Lentinula edodes]